MWAPRGQRPQLDLKSAHYFDLPRWEQPAAVSYQPKGAYQLSHEVFTPMQFHIVHRFVVDDCGGYIIGTTAGM